MTLGPSDSAPASAAPPRQRIILSAVEARVLATLMEKARTVPDSYPLTLNSLLLGSNQKTSRDPLMELGEADVCEALETLKSAGLVRESSGGRTLRYEHNFQRGVGVPEQSAVLLGLLMLRGPQTAAELRLNAERWYRFADVSSVEAFLEELQDRPDEKGGALVVRLERAPGTREQRWAHLLGGPVNIAAPSPVPVPQGSPLGAALQRIEALEAEVLRLRGVQEFLCAELGLTPPELQR
jgi:uncharacterized protein YceH (UPF0502 family)